MSAAVARDAERLRDALLTDWDTRRAAANQAAQIVAAGPGRFRQHRAAVTTWAKRADGSWRARYRDARGKEHSRHFGRKSTPNNGSTR
ncbi:hypothetical protein [uncultured Jatrophihabitans sp.]|uniref:hypothetical protein n=1 Tax=uncultured Jatrophihabitans sp. TaxID=1610747 RepID=UPI0035CBCB00